MYMDSESISEIKFLESSFSNYYENKNEILTIKSKNKLKNQINWKLPCSKSHFIRWLLLAAQSNEKTIIKVPSDIGNDILSCAKVLEKLGIKINKYEDYWTVKGYDLRDCKKIPKTLDCGNSATTLRFVTMLVARNGIEAIITGDESLSQRNFSELISILEKGGISVKKESPNKSLPFRVKGIWELDQVEVLTKKTSQLISALLVTVPSSIGNNRFIISQNVVSKPYFELTMRLCKKTGAVINLSKNNLEVSCWKPTFFNEIEVPGEASLITYPLLFSKLHGCDVLIQNWPKIHETLGFEMFESSSESFGLGWKEDKYGNICISNLDKNSKLSLNIKDNIDLITPLAILMGISNGGIIDGIKNAENKESNRVESTFNLCNNFGIIMECESNMIISKSELQSPKNLILTQKDHRLQMSGLILLSYTGGKIESFPWYENSDPMFLNRLQGYGVSIN